MSSPGTVLLVEDETVTFLVTECGVQKIMISSKGNVEKDNNGEVVFLDEDDVEFYTIH